MKKFFLITVLLAALFVLTVSIATAGDPGKEAPGEVKVLRGQITEVTFISNGATNWAYEYTQLKFTQPHAGIKTPDGVKIFSGIYQGFILTHRIVNIKYKSSGNVDRIISIEPVE